MDLKSVFITRCFLPCTLSCFSRLPWCWQFNLKVSRGSCSGLKHTLQAEIAVGRKSCKKKMLRGKSRNFRNIFFRNNMMFHNQQLFLQQQYNFLQFASVSSSNLYSNGSNRRPPAYHFFDCFFALLAPYSNPSCLLFFGICLSQILIVFLTLIVVQGQILYRSDRLNFSQAVQFPPYLFFLPIYQIFGKFHLTCLFHHSSFINYLCKFQTPCLFPSIPPPPPRPPAPPAPLFIRALRV